MDKDSKIKTEVLTGYLFGQPIDFELETRVEGDAATLTMSTVLPRGILRGGIFIWRVSPDDK